MTCRPRPFVGVTTAEASEELETTSVNPTFPHAVSRIIFKQKARQPDIVKIDEQIGPRFDPCEKLVYQTVGGEAGCIEWLLNNTDRP
jgi:hypothetical protein